MAKLFLLGPVIGGSFFALACIREPAPAQQPQQQRRAVNVTRLYNENCSNCHGENGQGGGAGTRTLNTRELFDQKHDRPFYDAIKNGVPERAMPAYGDTMSEEEMWALVVHVRELQARALRAEFGSPKADDAGVYHSSLHNFKIETVVDSGLNTPWSLDWLPDGRGLVTNRSGYMNLIEGGKLGARIEGLPESRELGQGGLMDVRVHPKNGWVYLTYTEPKKDGSNAGLTKLVRGKIVGTRWTDQQTVWEAPQEFYNGQGIHFGGKIVFDGKGHVFFSVGERGGNMKAQVLDNPWGKIYRLNEDGSVPKDNPFVGKTPFEGIWTFGHRNPQGIAIDLDGNVWDTEHGPRGGDEVNPIGKGKNYGWPVRAFSINYNDSPFVTPWPKAGEDITLPIFRWLPSIGASGLVLHEGKGFAKWKGDLLAGGLAGQNLDRIRVKDGKLAEREELIQGMGRIRDVRVAKDGAVYVVLNGPDKIVRLVPAP